MSFVHEGSEQRCCGFFGLTLPYSSQVPPLNLTWRGWSPAAPNYLLTGNTWRLFHLCGRGRANWWIDKSTVAHKVTVRQNDNAFPNGLFHSCVHWFNLCKALYCLWGLWVQFYAWLKRLLIAAIFVFKDLQRIKWSILDQWAIIN